MSTKICIKYAPNFDLASDDGSTDNSLIKMEYFISKTDALLLCHNDEINRQFKSEGVSCDSYVYLIIQKVSFHDVKVGSLICCRITNSPNIPTLAAGHSSNSTLSLPNVFTSDIENDDMLDAVCYAQIVEPYKLDVVVLQCIKELAPEVNFSKTLLPECLQKLLCSRCVVSYRKIFRLCGVDWVVKHCEPLDQGIISAKTSILFNTKIDRSTLNAPSEGFHHCLLSDFTEHSSDIVGKVEFPQLFYPELYEPECDQFFDYHGRIFLSNKDFVQLKIYPNSYVKMYVYNSEEELSGERVIMACPKDDVSSGKVHLTSVLYFNVKNCNKEPCFLFKKLSTLESDLSSSSSLDYQFTPAQEIHLSIIVLPFYEAAADWSEQIKLYFNIPRDIKCGDVIQISKGDKGANLLFKLVKVIPEISEVVTAVPNRTAIIQCGSVHQATPQNRLHRNVPGLQLYCRQLTSHLAVPSFSVVLLTGPPGCGKSLISRYASHWMERPLLELTCYDLIGETAGSTEIKIQAAISKAESCHPCFLLIRHVDALESQDNRYNARVIAFFKDLLDQFDRHKDVRLIVTAKSRQKLSPAVNSLFLHHIDVQSPGKAERAQMLAAAFPKCLNVERLAHRTAGLVYGDFAHLRSLSRMEAVRRITKLGIRDDQAKLFGFSTSAADIESALDVLQSSQVKSSSAPSIPNVRWEDIGGLDSVRSHILETIELPLKLPEIFQSGGLRRSGVLLYGPPGCGKTLVAKAVATECCLNFLSVKGPELLNMYIGQSEENVRNIFAEARRASPCVIFFDELDSLAPLRGQSGDSGGVTDRVVSQLLAELDGLERQTNLFVIGATNRPDLLDPALLRPGRFDKLLYLGIPEEPSQRMDVLKALTRKFILQEENCLKEVESACPENMTGADFYALSVQAYMNAMKRVCDQVQEGEPSSSDVVVKLGDFLSASSQITLSVSLEELKHYKHLQEDLQKKA